MTAFDTMLQADARNVFASLAELGEPVTYYPEGHEYDARECVAVVDRREVIPVGFGDTSTLVREATVHVPRGTAPDCIETVCKGVDLVEVVMVDGQPAVLARVARILDSDPGFWTLAVQW